MGHYKDYRSKRSRRKYRTYILTKHDIEYVGGLIASDEIFVECPHEKALFISNYGRLISTRSKEARLLKPECKKGYYLISLNTMENHELIRHGYQVHKLVAEAFVPVEEWIKPEDRADLQVHHITPVDQHKNIPSRHYASNLQWVPASIHKNIDRVEQIQVKETGIWTDKKFVEASKFLKITPYRFFEICGSYQKVPLHIDSDGWSYFSTQSEKADQCSDKNIFRIKWRETKKSVNKDK